VLRGRTLSIVRPRSAEALLSEEAFEREEFLPYWAEVWSSGVALAETVAEQDVAGARVLELGCGLGLPSLAAALGDAVVVATDWSPDALAVLRLNADRHGLTIETALVDWADPAQLAARAPWDLVLAADVLYERRNADQLLELLPQLGNAVLFADPGRPHAKTFVDRAAERWAIDEVARRGAVVVRRLMLTSA
jgi:predicted nicotinamide N-methyase